MKEPGEPQAVWDQAQALVDRRDRDALLAWLDDPDVYRREAAISGLGELGDPRDLSVLGALLGDMYVNDTVQAVLEDIGPATEPVLVLALDNPDGVGVLHALEALRAVGGAGAVDAIARRLGQGDQHVRSWAIEALSDIAERGAPSAAEVLRAHAAVESDPDLRDLLAAVLLRTRGEPGPA